MSTSRKKGYELMREIALHEIVGVIRARGAASAPEIMSATGRSRGNVDGYLRELEEGGHVLRGLPPVAQRKGATFVYSAPEGQVRELPKREPSVTTITGREHDELTNHVVTGSALPTRFRGSRPEIPPTDYTPIEQRAAAFQASQVVNESRGKPIPMYDQQIQGTPVPARDEFEPAEEDLIECGPCSEAGGADRAVRHTAPACKPSPRPHPADKLPEPFQSNEKIRDAEAKRERRDDQRWRAGFTHLTKGGEFELRDDGGGKTSVRRADKSGPAVQLNTSDALAMFVEKPASKPKAPASDEVWVTPVPNTAPVPKPRPRKTGAEDLGHFGQGSGADDANEGEQDTEVGES